MSTSTQNNIQLEIKDGIAHLTFDTPGKKVNVLSTECLTELKGVLEELRGKAGVKALLLKSAKQGIFIAGADIKEIESISTASEGRDKAKSGQDIFNLLEDLPFPSMALINGVCLGGGMELSLACTYRFASSVPALE